MNLLKQENGVQVGIRPEDIRIDQQGLSCRLQSREWHGASQMLLLESDRGLLRMVCSGDQEIQEQLQVSWQQASEHRFDLTSGSRINE